MVRRAIPGTVLGLAPVEIAVFVAGVASIGLEILAGRVLAPEFGTGVYTWGSIIGVVLTALGVGYALGGRRAPEYASPAAVARLLLAAAAFVAVLLAGGDLVLRAADGLPLPARLAPLVPMALLFGPPVFFLGFVSPYAAELSPAPSAGSASGRVYALGTAGSIVGVFGTTFLLIPAFDVHSVELGFGALLVGAAGLVVLADRDDPAGPAAADERAGAGTETGTGAGTGSGESAGAGPRAVVLVGALLVGASAVGGLGLATPGTVVYETQTPYQELRVVDDDGVRTLYLDGTPQSATSLPVERPDDRYVFEYSRYLHLPLLVTEDVDRVLFVGGGGFSSPKRFLELYPDAEVDVVELDPEVVRVAREYFGLADSPRLEVHVGDGREFLERTDRTYDVIVLDAYRSDRVPFHLTTVEFMRLARSRLDDDGALVANVISASEGSGSAFFRAQYKTMRTAFPHSYAFPTADTPFLQNVVLLATTSGYSEADLAARARERDVGVPLADAVDRYRGPDDVPTEDVPLLRDDRAPVDRLLDPQLGRRYVVVRNDSGTASRVS